jgi:hypothetical protein
MSFSPFRIMLEQAKTPGFRALAERLVKTSDEFHKLEAEFPNRIAANRERREGRPIQLPKRHANFLANREKDAIQAEADLEKQYRAMTDEQTMLQSALSGEKFLFQTWAWLYDSVHTDDKPMAISIRALHQKLIDDMEKYLTEAD